MSFFDSLKKKIYDLFNVKTKTSSDPNLDNNPDEHFGPSNAESIWRNHLDDLLQHNAPDKVRYADYDLMDQEIPEVSVSLDVTADFVVFPDSTNKSKIFKVKPVKKNANVQSKIDEIDQKFKIPSQLYSVVRDVCKYGDTAEELLTDINSKIILGTKNIPIESVLFNIKDGVPQDIPFLFQVDPANKEIARLNSDEGLHFQLPSDRKRLVQTNKGVSRLEKARLIYRQVRLMEEGVIINRLSKANQNYAIMIDVGDLVGDEALQFIDKYKKRITRRKYVDPKTGRMSLQYNPLSVLEDIYVPTRQGSGAGVTPLMNDRGGRQIDDVVHFQNKLIYATGVPKLLIGKEEDVNSKSTADTQFVTFLRTVRRIQISIEPELLRYYKMILEKNYGIKDVELTIEWPLCGTIDEKMRWEIETLKATLAATLGKDLMMFDDAWLYKNIFNMSDEEIDALTSRMDQEEAKAQAQSDANLEGATFDADETDPVFDEPPKYPSKAKPNDKKKAGSGTTKAPTKDKSKESILSSIRGDFKDDRSYQQFLDLHSKIASSPVLEEQLVKVIKYMKLVRGDLT